MRRDERRSSRTKRVRETEAEAVAFVVCRAVGLETGSAAQDYIGVYGGDAKLHSEGLEYIQRTATQVLNAIVAPRINLTIRYLTNRVALHILNCPGWGFSDVPAQRTS
jgi:hypothetical protein